MSNPSASKVPKCKSKVPKCKTESAFSETGFTKFLRTCADKSRNSQILGINSRNPSESNPQSYRLSRLVNHKAVYFPKSPEGLLIFFSRKSKDHCPSFSAAPPSTIHLHLQAQTNTMQTPINKHKQTQTQISNLKHKDKTQKSCLVDVSYIPVPSGRRAPPFSAWVGVGVANPGQLHGADQLRSAGHDRPAPAAPAPPPELE